MNESRRVSEDADDTELLPRSSEQNDSGKNSYTKNDLTPRKDLGCLSVMKLVSFIFNELCAYPFMQSRDFMEYVAINPSYIPEFLVGAILS